MLIDDKNTKRFIRFLEHGIYLNHTKVMRYRSIVNIFWEIVWKIILNSFFRDDREEINKLAQEIQQKLRYPGQEAVCCFSVTS